MRRGLMVVTALHFGVAGQVHGQRVEPERSTLQLTDVRAELALLTPQEIPPECIGAAATEGLIVAAGGFLVYKILGGLPLFGAPPSNRASDATAIAVFVAAGVAYAVWRANRCDSRISFLRLAEPRRTISASSIGPNRVGFSRHERLHPGQGLRSMSPTRTPATPALPQF